LIRRENPEAVIDVNPEAGEKFRGVGVRE
jgi:hypothetical protein